MTQFDRSRYMYSTEHRSIETLTAAEPKPNRNRFIMFCYFKNVVHSLEPGETQSNSTGSKLTRRLTRLQTMHNVLKYRRMWWNNDEISIYRNRSETAQEPETNQFNYAQYCSSELLACSWVKWHICVNSFWTIEAVCTLWWVSLLKTS